LASTVEEKSSNVTENLLEQPGKLRLNPDLEVMPIHFASTGQKSRPQSFSNGEVE
jgi:hypothetical protein